ncbi:MAG: purine-nucleoside phosphorylase [Verrucomicrobiaceae bacterium]|nr:purine-nucleoside phosphorylase [Verrucomicrobiaceae bacterium]
MSLTDLQDARPETAIVLGSGLGAVAEAFGIEYEVLYADVPGLSASTVLGHAGRFVLARHNGKPILIAQGRRHLYEGLTAHEVTAGVRFMHSIGVKRVVLTNAAGAIHESFHIGGLMLIADHINLQGVTPLLGGAHFHDMSEVYSAAWREKLHAAAQTIGLKLHSGVYAALLGPQYETPAEIRMLRTIGADAVGMSTVPEAIQARALDMEVAGISMLTNWAAGLKPQTLHHAEVVEVGKAAGACLARLLKAALFHPPLPGV